MLKLIIGFLFGASVAFLAGEGIGHRPPPVDLPEEYMTISTDANNPSNMIAWQDKDSTIHIGFDNRPDYGDNAPEDK